MAFTVPKIEPREIVAGDRLQWRREDLGDFPAATWTLTYYFRGSNAGSQYDIVAAADGNNFEVDVSPDVSAVYIPGIYYWSAYVSASGDRKLVAQGRLTISPNPADILQPTDGRSHARRVLEAIQATIEKRATHDMQRYVLQATGRSIDRMPINDLMAFLAVYEGKVRTEDEKEAIARGEASGRNILIRFKL